MRLLAMPLALALLAAAPSDADEASTAVVGEATIEGSAKKAVVQWTYLRNGEKVETRKPPRMRITRMTSSVPKLAVKLPTEAFAIKIGTDLQRIFDEPVLLDSDQEVVCSCRLLPECGNGTSFQCQVEGRLVGE